MFTPKELQEKTFDKAVFGGYDMQMVDEFLEPLTEDYITLYKENSVLKSKMKILVEKLEEYRAQELSMKKALVAAQQTSDSIVAEAQKKASRILNDAEESAQNRGESLRQEFSAEEQRVQRARDAAQAFIATLEQEITQHLALLNQLKQQNFAPDLEAPAPAKDGDLSAEIGSAVQAIAGGETKDFKFEDLQFGKDYTFAK